MLAMWMVQVAIDEIVNMVAMRYSLVAAARAMHVGYLVALASMVWRTAIGIGSGNLDSVLVDMVVVDMMQVPVVQVVDVTVMMNCRVAAAGAVLMRMIDVVGLGAFRHLSGSFLLEKTPPLGRAVNGLIDRLKDLPVRAPLRLVLGQINGRMPWMVARVTARKCAHHFIR
jgi:hypothetical protein